MIYLILFLFGLGGGYLWASHKWNNYYRGAINMAYRKGIARGQALVFKEKP